MKPILVACGILTSAMAQAASLPAAVGQCTETTIRSFGARLADSKTGRAVEGSGVRIEFADGLAQVSYDEVPEISRSRPGDQVIVCLVKLPSDCPPGDDRGRFYTTTNLRTMESWTLPDSQHTCGGA